MSSLLEPDAENGEKEVQLISSQLRDSRCCCSRLACKFSVCLVRRSHWCSVYSDLYVCYILRWNSIFKHLSEPPLVVARPEQPPLQYFLCTDPDKLIGCDNCIIYAWNAQSSADKYLHNICVFRRLRRELCNLHASQYIHYSGA